MERSSYLSVGQILADVAGWLAGPQHFYLIDFFNHRTFKLQPAYQNLFLIHGSIFVKHSILYHLTFFCSRFTTKSSNLEALGTLTVFQPRMA